MNRRGKEEKERYDENWRIIRLILKEEQVR